MKWLVSIKKGIKITSGWDIFEVDSDFSVQMETEYIHPWYQRILQKHTIKYRINIETGFFSIIICN